MVLKSWGGNQVEASPREEPGRIWAGKGGAKRSPALGRGLAEGWVGLRVGLQERSPEAPRWCPGEAFQWSPPSLPALRQSCR